MKVLKTFFTFLLWDIAFYLMISIMIIAINYESGKYAQTMDISYQNMYMGLSILLWFLIGGFLVFLVNFKRSLSSKNARLIGFLVVCIPAAVLTLSYFIKSYWPSFPLELDFGGNRYLLMSVGALVVGCEVFGLIIKKKR